MKKLLLFITVLFVKSAAAQYGVLDNSFNGTGYVANNFGISGDYGRNVLQAADGGLIICGGATGITGFDFGMQKYHLDGTLDYSFGDSGKVTTSLSSGADFAQDMVFDNNGKIILCGYTTTPADDDVSIARYFSNGMLDSSFATNGSSTLDFGYDEDINAIEMQPDGKIVAGGVQQDGGTQQMILMRYLADGSLDSSFGTNGFIANSFLNTIKDVKILANGKILVGGYISTSLPELAIAEFNSDGNVNTAFGYNGIYYFSLPGSTYNIGWKLAVQQDGKFLLAGESLLTGYQFVVARFNASGLPDSTFATNGIFTSALTTTAANGYAILIQPDGKIVAGGYAQSNFALTRLDSTGIPDPQFGVAGVVLSALGTANFGLITSLTLENDNKIIASGTIANPVRSFGIARYTSGLSVGIIDLSKNNITGKAYPNPVGRTTTVDYTLVSDENISIGLYDMQGRLAQQFMQNEKRSAGMHSEALELNSTVGAGNYSLIISNGLHRFTIELVKE